MREILFRGKRVDNGEWVEGYYCGKVNETMFSPATESAQIIDADLYWHEVIQETVGQYTGLNDMKGKKIFEGDVLKVLEDGRHFTVVLFKDGSFGFEWYWGSRKQIRKEFTPFTGMVNARYKILCNIYDNRKLWRRIYE